MTAASEPGLIAVPARTMWSYWRYTQFFDAIVGQPSSLAKAAPGSAKTGMSSSCSARVCARYAGSRASRWYSGASSASLAAGTEATTSPWFFTTIIPSPVTSPTSAHGRSHLSKIRLTSSSRPLCTMMSIRSCDSLSKIS